MSKYVPVNNFYSKLITIARRFTVVAERLRPSLGGCPSKRLDTLGCGHNNYIEDTWHCRDTVTTPCHVCENQYTDLFELSYGCA